MNILIFDTSTNYCSVALKLGNKVVSELAYAPQKHNEHLLDLFNRVIVRSGIKKREIDILAYGLGPGSFVGIRLSAALTQAISFLTSATVIGFSTLYSIALHVHKRYKHRLITVVLNAAFGDFYIGQYRASNHKFILYTFFEKRVSYSNLINFITLHNCGIIVGSATENANIFFDVNEYVPNSRYMFSSIYKTYNDLSERESVSRTALPVYLGREVLHNHCKKL